MKSNNFWESNEAIIRYTSKPELWDSEIRFIFKAVQTLDKKVSDIKILDLGCGGGRTTIPLFKMGFDITGLDISANLINELKKKSPKTKTVVGDAKKLPFQNLYFDIVLFSHNSVDYFQSEKERIKSLKEIHRVLCKKGYLIFSSHYFNLIPTNRNALDNILSNFLKYITSTSSGYYLEKMQNGDIVKTFYTSPLENIKFLDKLGFEFLDYTKIIDTSKSRLKDFIKSVTTWEIYYCFEKK